MKHHYSRLSRILSYSFTNKNVRTSALLFSVCMLGYWLISVNPLDNFLQKANFEKLQNEIDKLENLSKDSALLNRITDTNSKGRIDSFEDKFLSYQVYDAKDYSLNIWTASSYMLNQQVLDNLDILSYRQIEDYHFLLKKIVNGQKLIVFWYSLDRYIDEELNSSFVLFHEKKERHEYKIIGYTEVNSISFKDSHQQFLFSLKRTIHANDFWTVIALIVIVMAVFFLIKTYFYLTQQLTRLYPIVGCLVFSCLVYATRKILLYYKLPSIFYSLKLFNPSLYSSDVTPSLGDLLLFVFSTQVILFYLQEHLDINLKKWHNSAVAFVVHTLALIFLLGESFSINKIFERMVVESSIWFNFDYFPRLTIYSFIGLGIMLMTFSNYYLLSNLILKTISQFNIEKRRLMLSFGIFFFFVLGLIVFTDFRLEVKLTFILLVFFIFLFYARYLYNLKSKVFSFSIFLIFASFTTTLLLSRYNIKKEEVVLSSIASNVTFGIDKSLEKNIIQKLESNAIPEIISCFADLKLVGIREIDQLEYQNYIDSKAITTNSLVKSSLTLKLFIVNTESGGIYIAQKNNGRTSKYYFIFPNNHLNKVTKTTKAAINDIIIRDNKISYGLYIKDSLYEQSGFFNYKKIYPYTQETIEEKEDLYGIDFEHSIKKIGSDVKVIVTTQQTNPVSILTQFSYIFCINFILALLLLFIAWLLRITYLGLQVFQLKDLRSKIVLAIFLIVIGIFSGITLLSFNSLRDKFLNYNQEVKYNNLKVTQKATEEYFNYNDHQPETMVDEFFKKIKSLSSIHYELYNDKGLLIKTSKSNFLNELYPRLLNPEVFQELNSESETILDKKKDPFTTSKIEAYSKLYNHSTNKSTYLRLTAEEETNSQNDEMRLMVVLINLYVIFFLISIAFAIWLANRITQPLQSLAQRISKLGLSKQNEYLDYKYDDEIGELVKRYNIMVDEIQESARQLAEQQREEAWSEMAKQIAHEIKNPLTPMKLKIQFLQKKLKDGAENIDQLVQSTAETLIEQINNLDNIASSFSNFARLHTPYMESLDWIPLIKSVTNIFDNKMTNVHFMTYLPKAYIQGDRNQMISCLNNLIKNAIQAYDDEDATVDLVLEENQENYILIIKDYGKGIKEEEQDKIFIPNFTTKNSGSGLGLAITKKILAAMNGKIRFESKLGLGTSFYVSIPKQRALEEIQFTALEIEWNDKGLKPVIDGSVYSSLEYVHERNVFNQKFYHDFNKPYLHIIAYNKLLKASEILIGTYPNYRLIIKDALRPYGVQKSMWESYSGNDKEKFIATPERDSMHNYGMAIDVLILEVYNDIHTPNRIIDFGSPFDEFSERSHFDYDGLTEVQMNNRKLLNTIMRQAGFVPYDNEYWHFEAMDKNWVRENCERL